MSVLVLTGLCSSKSEARRNIQQGGVSVNDEKVSDISRSFTADELKAGVVLKRGKKKTSTKLFSSKVNRHVHRKRQ